MPELVTTWLFHHLAALFGFALAAVLFSGLMREQKPPGSTLAWLLSFILIPWAGVPLYLLIGRRKLPGTFPDPVVAPLPATRFEPLESALAALGVPAATSGNRLELLPDGETAYRRLLELIDDARYSLEISTFILGRDPVARAILDRLCRRAREGVHVRLLLDALGCLRTRGRFVAPLRRAGGEVGVFLPVLPTRKRWSAHLRNHRKIVVADGRRALVGGMNLAAEYIGPTPTPRRWADFAVVVEGPAAHGVRTVFAADWRFATGRSLPADAGDRAQPGPQLADATTTPGRIQVVTSGPDVANEPLHDSLLTAMLQARNRVWVVTPYFVPDDLLAAALAVLARQGRDVRVVVPRRSNHRIADLARVSHLRALARAGGAVLGYGPGMLHAKLVVVDDSLATVGSANLDMRSLYLDYEIALYLHGPEEVRQVVEHIEHRLLPVCRPLAVPERRKEGVARLVAQDLARLVSPLL